MILIYFFQLLLFFFLLFFFAKPLGWYLARVYSNKPCGLHFLLNPIERFIYRFCGISPKKEMNWKTYLGSLLFFNALGIVFLYFLQRLQNYLPLNLAHFNNVDPKIALNTAISFTSNTDWQAYQGEKNFSYLTHMFGLTLQNFLSAATGLCGLIAFIRSLSRQETEELGNFWVDLVKSILYILLPLSLIFACFLSSQGVIQNFKPYQNIQTLTSAINTLPMGPVASQVAIKQLGSNGGGFFNANSAHPFENPTPLSNFFEMLAMLLIPVALCFTFGIMIQDRRQSWAILLTMLIIFVPLSCITMVAEIKGNTRINNMGSIFQDPLNKFAIAGNMEGKEVRFGALNSAFWSSVATATSAGATNSALDSFTPLGGLIPLFFMHLGETIFGGVGCGLYSMFIYIIITVFMASLMVGRTPEYLGKKIEPFEMKMAAIIVLIVPTIVLISTASAVITPAGRSGIGNPLSHGFTEILYAFTSMANNNGSSFAGLDASNGFYTLLGSLVMLIGRYGVLIPILALAGSLAKKKFVPITSGTLPTHTPFFVILLICIILILGALSFFPALILGPIIEIIY